MPVSIPIQFFFRPARHSKLTIPLSVKGRHFINFPGMCQKANPALQGTLRD